MFLADLCVKRPVFATMLIMALVVVGWFSYDRLGLDLLPKIDRPTITITTRLAGASPEEMETQITKLVEESVNTISGLEELRSSTTISPMTHEASGDYIRNGEHPSHLTPDDSGVHPSPGQPPSSPVHDGQGHGSHSHKQKDYRNRFIVSMILTVPILILSPTIQSFFGFSFGFPGSDLLILFLATPVYLYGGWPFLKGIVGEIRNRLPGMMTLIAIAITVAYIFSAAVVLGFVGGEPFFWELATLIDVMLLGHWVEMRSVLGASRALEELVKIMPSEAHLLKEGGTTVDVRVENLMEKQ